MVRRQRSRRIYYYCYDHQRPRGGQRETYRHVEILCENGFEAFVFHESEKTRLSWFDSFAPSVGRRTFELAFDRDHDFVVLPEDLGWSIGDFVGRKVIFNKGVGGGFEALRNGDGVYPYLAPEVVAAFAMSGHDRHLLNLAFPNLLTFRMYSEVDGSLFQPTPLSQKAPIIGLIHKSSPCTLAAYHTLRARGAQGLNRADYFDWRFLSGLTQRDLSKALAEVLLVIFSSASEGGTPRTLLEAMASGCLVAAMSVEPMREGLPNQAQFGFDDVAGVVTYLEELMERYPDRLDPYVDAWESGITMSGRFTMERQADAVLSAWGQLMGL